MTRLSLPTNLAETAEGAAEPGLAAWVADLPRVVNAVAQRWAVRLGEPFQPGGRCSWVAPARDPAGRDLVLKVGWVHPEARHEAEGLTFWAGEGAVILHAADTFDATSALLLERCRPGTSLNQAVAEPEQDMVVAGLLLRLWREPAAGHPFRDLRVMCHEWAAGFERRLRAAPDIVDPGLARAALDLLRTLPGSAQRHVLLCTDLHAENILAAEREPWLVCDPKPYVGDPTYDPMQHMLNCEERLVADPGGFADRLAGLLGLEPARLRLWLFARCAMESVESPMLRDVATRLLPA